MQKQFIISDLHFGHTNIIKYENRPFNDTRHMNETMIDNWNKVVSKKDKVYVLGDVSFLNKEETKQIVSQLYGYKTLIMGNHDKGRGIKWWYDIGFDEVYKHPIILNEFLFLSHEPPQYIPNNIPYFYFYGHVHGSEMYQTITKKSACVCVERWDYTPVEINEILKLSKTKW